MVHELRTPRGSAFTVCLKERRASISDLLVDSAAKIATGLGRKMS